MNTQKEPTKQQSTTVDAADDPFSTQLKKLKQAIRDALVKCGFMKSTHTPRNPPRERERGDQ